MGMGHIRRSQPVKLIVGFIFKQEDLLTRAEAILRRAFGPIDFQSSILDFDHTSYYQHELGTGLKRKFLSFQKLISPERLSRIKLLTNKLERKCSRQGQRQINIDPGYLDMAKLVLASTKDFRHRIYLNRGIFAEITLFYQNKSFQFWEWTYPDYRSPEYIAVFNKIRDIYSNQTIKEIQSLKLKIQSKFKV